jgi:hypothetical protein
LCWAVTQLPEIKLIRTDTTLDLSQKAEKVIISVNIQSLILLVIQKMMVMKYLHTQNYMHYDYLFLSSRIPKLRNQKKKKRKRKKKNEEDTTPAIPTWSPTVVLDGPHEI